MFEKVTLDNQSSEKVRAGEEKDSSKVLTDKDGRSSDHVRGETGETKQKKETERKNRENNPDTPSGSALNRLRGNEEAKTAGKPGTLDKMRNALGIGTGKASAVVGSSAKVSTRSGSSKKVTASDTESLTDGKKKEGGKTKEEERRDALVNANRKAGEPKSEYTEEKIAENAVPSAEAIGLKGAGFTMAVKGIVAFILSHPVITIALLIFTVITATVASMCGHNSTVTRNLLNHTIVYTFDGGLDRQTYLTVKYSPAHDYGEIIDGRFGDLSLTVEEAQMFIEYAVCYKNSTGLYNDISKFSASRMSYDTIMSESIYKEFESAWIKTSESVGFAQFEADQQTWFCEKQAEILGQVLTKSGINDKDYKVGDLGYPIISSFFMFSRLFDFEAYISEEASGSATDDPSDTENETANPVSILFDGLVFAEEDVFIDALYENAEKALPEKAELLSAAHADAVAMKSKEFDIYKASSNAYGSIDWDYHKLRFDPTDSYKYDAELSNTPDPRIPAHNEHGTAIAENYIAYAKSSHQKLPYVFGGTSLETGADCSGFVSTILAMYGFLDPDTAKIHGYSSWTYRTNPLGTHVELDDIRVGDVVCYDGHVAFYIGNGQIVHEPSKNRVCKVEYASVFLSKPILDIRRFSFGEQVDDDYVPIY